jgi:ABC-2 type transport system permease protein
MVQPFACVFYGVEVLPVWMQWISLAMPPAHIFEGMRGILAGNGIDPSRLIIATGLNVLYLAAAGLLFNHMLGVARKRGLLVKSASS